jgi:hypothetical protein
MENKKTAVEWLVEELKSRSIDLSKWNNDLLEQSKQIDKQNIVDAWENGYENGAGVNDDSIYHGNIYYNNAFKGTI